jgi:hypothetical protein
LKFLFQFAEISVCSKARLPRFMMKTPAPKLLPAFVFLAAFSVARAQEDVLYFRNDSKKVGIVSEIGQEKIQFRQSEDAPVEKISKADLVLVLFQNGAFLTFPSEYRGTEGPPDSRHAEDWLVTREGNLIACTIQNADSDPVLVSAMGDTARKDYSVPREKLASILFANGKKQLLGTRPALLAEYLKKRNLISAADFLAPFELKPAEPKKKKQGPELDLDQASYEQFKQKSLQKTDDLGKYLNLIANRSTDPAVANKAVDQAVSLFLSDSSTVETTKPNGDRDQQPVRSYLNKLKLLKYSRVVIEWTDISYVSNLRRGPDGYYYGVISLQQKFSGFIDNKMVYSDVTRKNVEVVLKTYKKEVDGETVELWDVFLNNVGISASRN